jgi:hypothetical protein
LVTASSLTRLLPPRCGERFGAFSGNLFDSCMAVSNHIGHEGLAVPLKRGELRYVAVALLASVMKRS